MLTALDYVWTTAFYDPRYFFPIEYYLSPAPFSLLFLH